MGVLNNRNGSLHFLDAFIRIIVGTVINPAITPANVGIWVSVNDKKCGIENVNTPVINTSVVHIIANNVHNELINSITLRPITIKLYEFNNKRQNNFYCQNTA